jgi:hypothetical protein
MDGLAEDGWIEVSDSGDVFRSAGVGGGWSEKRWRQGEQSGKLSMGTWDEHGGPLVDLSAGIAEV